MLGLTTEKRAMRMASQSEAAAISRLKASSDDPVRLQKAVAAFHNVGIEHVEEHGFLTKAMERAIRAWLEAS